MKNLKSITPAQKAGYKGVKVMSMIKAIESQEVFKHLRLVQQNEFSCLKNKYNKAGQLSQPYFSYLWMLYWNFVLNNFRFDTDREWTVVSKIKTVKSEHIGMRVLKSLQS